MTDEELRALVAENSKQVAEVWRLFKETDQKMAASNAEVNQKLTATDRKIDRLAGKWGRFVEYFLAPGIPQAFQEIGIAITCTMQRLKKAAMEVDILGLNHDCLVVVEVKSTLGREDVDEFLEALPNFRAIFPEFFPTGISKAVYGAMAGIEIHEKADRYAYQKGLYVLAQKGDTVKVQNDGKFKPKMW